VKTGGVIISIDGGGTKTTAVAVTREGKVVGSGVSGPGNHVLSPIEVVRKSLREAVSLAMKSAGAEESDLLIISGDTAGIGHQREGAQYVEAILTEVFEKTPVYLVGDMVAGFYGAMPKDRKSGVVATAGTGSSIYGLNEDGEGLQVGGWGHIIGDEGSAYYIAVSGMRAASKAFDGRGAPTSLTTAFPKHFGVDDMFLVQIPIYLGEIMTREEIEGGDADVEYSAVGSGLSREKIAASALVVATEAEKGDDVAVSVMKDAAEELGLAVVTVAEKLAIPKDDLAVSYTGSVFKAGVTILGPFSQYILKQYPKAQIMEPALPTVGGGVRIAFTRLGFDFGPAAENLTKGLKELGDS
jgi:N-acetylglucosamine kinase